MLPVPLYSRFLPISVCTLKFCDASGNALFAEPVFVYFIDFVYRGYRAHHRGRESLRISEYAAVHARCLLFYDNPMELTFSNQFVNTVHIFLYHPSYNLFPDNPFTYYFHFACNIR